MVLLTDTLLFQQHVNVAEKKLVWARTSPFHSYAATNTSPVYPKLSYSEVSMTEYKGSIIGKQF